MSLGKIEVGASYRYDCIELILIMKIMMFFCCTCLRIDSSG